MVTELNNLKKYISNNAGFPCYVGPNSTSQFDYIRLMPADFSFTTFNKKTEGVNFPIAIQIVVDRNNTIRGFEILEKLIKTLNSFDYDSGSLLQDDGSPEYTENEFVITIIFNLKTILQGA